MGTDIGQIYEVLKLIILLIILVFIAIKDIKEYRIPNKLLLSAIIIRTILFIGEIIHHKVNIDSILNKIVIVLSVFVIGIILILITRNGIGFGDIKLLMTVSLFINNNRIIDVIIYSIFIMGIIAIIMLITRKKGRKDIVPFAPAILMAVLVTGVSYL